MRYTKPKLIQLIHIAKHKLGIDEDTYRLILQNTTGKSSCKEMTITELMKVHAHFEQTGFNKTAKRRLAGKTASPASKTAIVNSRIALKIRAMWIEMYRAGWLKDGSEQALNAFVRGVVNQSNNGVLKLNVQSLNNQEASRVLERLKKWQKRLGG